MHLLITSFYLRRTNRIGNPTYRLFCRLTHAGQRLEFSLGHQLLKDEWNPTKQRPCGISVAARSAMDDIESMLFMVGRYRRQCIESDDPIDLMELKDRITPNSAPSVGVLECYEKHNQHIKELIGIDFALATWKRHQTVITHLRDYMTDVVKRKDLPLHRLNRNFVEGFQHYLQVQQQVGYNTTMRYLKQFKKITNQAIREDKLAKDPFSGIKLQPRKVVKEVLNENELKAVIDLDITMERLERVRDIFVFSCFTGLSYVDIRNLKHTHIEEVEDGIKVIFQPRMKTRELSTIPVMDVAERLIEKYRNHPVCRRTNAVFPVLTNQKMNAYLKEIGDRCGIHKNMSFHMARRTFATTIAALNGIPIEHLARMMGHADLRMTMQYAQIDYRSILSSMRKVDMKYGR